MNPKAFHASIAAATLAVLMFQSGCNMNFTMVDGYSFDRTGVTAESSEHGEISPGITQVEIVNRFGDVKIESAAGEPGWGWDSKVWADSQEQADLYITDLVLDVTTNGETQTWNVLLPEPESDLNGVQSNLTLRLPAGVKVKLENRHGQVDVSDIASDIELSNAHGDLTLTGLEGSVVAKNSHGNLKASQLGDADLIISHGNSDLASVTGNATLQSSHGDVKAQAIVGQFKVKNSHGNIVADEITGDVTATNSHGSTDITTTAENVSVHSAHGKIKLNMNNAAFQSIDLKTSHNDVTVAIPGSANPAIQMKTTHGKMKSDFDSAAEAESDSGSDSDAQPKVKLNNQHGDIRVEKK